ncbi:MAG: tryptophan 7-halogenase [Chloroflexi bacterium]|nr:tryptophan 7-halogenase [Chloroflexota bacterium]
MPDVIVIGGGPGGSTAATFLARRGHSVVLLERDIFPRDHVGESLLPASMPVLEELGVLRQIEAENFPKKFGATMVWGKDDKPWSWYFRETNRTYPHSYQVSRPRFDQILLENSRTSGVDVREGFQVIEAMTDEDTGAVRGARYRDDDGTVNVLEAGFVIDASGQSTLLAHAMSLRQWDSFFQNLAVYAYYRGGKRLPNPDETNIFIESYQQGWTWTIPLKDGMTSVGAVVDSEVGQSSLSALGPAEFLKGQIAQTLRTRKMLSDAELVDGPHVIRDWSYTTNRMVGDGWILVGDAACFVDPLFSSGVHLALMSGVMAAAYVHAAHDDSTMRVPAGQVYEQLYRKEYAHFRELASLFYASNRTAESYFWQARRILGDTDLSARESFIRAVAGQPPRGYERAVLSRGELPSEIAEMFDGAESDRRLREARIAQGLSPNLVPHLAEGAKLERRPIFAEGEFQWSMVLSSPMRPEGTPLSNFVAALVKQVDGQRNIGQIIERLTQGVDDTEQVKQAEDAALNALGILYVDGAVERLKPFMINDS